ncbi:MAG: restriction endonuclease subunit S [Planctomycetes bacterium]|nr:restriction endonuclease subunit S [Planctomycetota bacterium]
MAGEWKKVRLGDVVTLQRGFDLPSQNRRPGKVPIVSSSGISDYHSEVGVKGPGVVTGRYGTIGHVFLIEEDFWPLNTTLWVKDFHGNDPQFASYLLRTVDFQSCSDKSSVPGVNRNDLHRIAVRLPPLVEQKAIAAVLGALDDKIELNRRMNATLEAMARALFQSWFVDFDPVRAKLDGRPPAALDPATAALFPEHFAHGERDMLPVGWRLAAIEEVCAINAWTLGKNDDLETLEYVEISEVSRGNIANIATYPRGEEPSRARRRLRHGDTVLSTVRPDRGSYFLALHPPENRVASTGFAVLTPTKVPWTFIHAALTQPEVSDHLGQMADGGAYPAVRPEVIGAMQVALPDEPKILEAFHRTCAPLFQQAEAHRTQSRTLATLRDTLLPKLLSGDIAAGIPEPTLSL